jgi:hypothetical protein
MDAFCIGNDILDIGSRRTEARVRRSAKFDADLRGAPTHFDLPNVPDVSAAWCLVACIIITRLALF